MVVNGVPLSRIVWNDAKHEPAVFYVPTAFILAGKVDITTKNMWNRSVKIPLSEIRNPSHHTIMRLENLVNSLPDYRQSLTARREDVAREAAASRSMVTAPSPYADELAEAKESLKAVNREINRQKHTGIIEHQPRVSF